MNAIKKNLIAGAINMIGRDTIVETINQVITGLLAQKKNIPVLEGESAICALFYEVNEEIFYSTVAVREAENNELIICRFIQVQKISDLISAGLKLLD